MGTKIVISQHIAPNSIIYTTLQLKAEKAKIPTPCFKKAEKMNLANPHPNGDYGTIDGSIEVFEEDIL